MAASGSVSKILWSTVASRFLRHRTRSLRAWRDMDPTCARAQAPRWRLLSGSCALGAVVAVAGFLSSRSLVQPAGEDALSSKRGWRGQLERGEYDVVAERLLRGDARIADEPATLMDAADALRFADQPEAAVDCLRRVLREHATSPVAPLAGFTLGRVLLERLGQPSEAAEAFALARSLKPDSSLAQDALASEVEAWSKAGRALDAFSRAQLYVQLYPAGRRLRAVRTLGGL